MLRIYDIARYGILLRLHLCMLHLQYAGFPKTISYLFSYLELHEQTACAADNCKFRKCPKKSICCKTPSNISWRLVSLLKKMTVYYGHLSTRSYIVKKSQRQCQVTYNWNPLSSKQIQCWKGNLMTCLQSLVLLVLLIPDYSYSRVLLLVVPHFEKKSLPNSRDAVSQSPRPLSVPVSPLSVPCQSLVNPLSVPSVHCQGLLCASACVQVLRESRDPPMPMSKCVCFISLHDSHVVLVWEVRHFGGDCVWYNAVSFVVKDRNVREQPKSLRTQWCSFHLRVTSSEQFCWSRLA